MENYQVVISAIERIKKECCDHTYHVRWLVVTFLQKWINC